MSTAEFKSARDLLLALRDNYEFARSGFQWPKLKRFNWALDWFDAELARGEHGAKPALKILGEKVETLTFAQLSQSSSRAASGLAALGAKRGDRIVLMMGNRPELWIATLAAFKLGLVVIPATPQLTEPDVADRLQRGQARFVIAEAAFANRFGGADLVKIATRGAAPGWRDFAELLNGSPNFRPEGPTQPDDPLLLYFTSGTTARPKLVLHSHASYPVGHLSTMFGLGLKPGDVHLNISSPGWAKHAWSNVFAPWNAGACVVALDKKFDARSALDDLVAHEVTSFCAPPTVWRQFVQLPMGEWKTKLRELNSAGEPLNPEIIEQVRRFWGLTVRDSYGQTETTMMIGNAVGQRVVPGAMGRPLPGWRVALLDAAGLEADEGEIAVPLNPRPVALMRGYQDDGGTIRPLEGAYYRTGDVASRDAGGYLTYVGRADDVFKSNDYRLSPFELESALIEHPSVAEAAVVPAPDLLRQTTPKAYVMLAEGFAPTAETARDIFLFLHKRLASFKRVRRLEFADLPKTISGKIRRVELRGREAALFKASERPQGEFRVEDFPDIG